MNENKRFKLYIKWYNQEKTEGEFVLKDGGQPLGVINSIEDARLIRDTLNELNNENKRMTDKLNKLALELLNYEMITMGKATEISEMCYHDFLKYRNENGNPMELQL